MAIIQIPVTNVYRRIEAATGKTVVNVGGTGSSKTHSKMQFFLNQRILKYPNYRLLILRKVKATIEESNYKPLKELMKQQRCLEDFKSNESKLTLTNKFNGSFVMFSGLDKVGKHFGPEYDDIWIEEANEITFNDYLELKSRLYRGEKKKGYDFVGKIYMSLNPRKCWIKSKDGFPGYEFIYSTHKDNPFMNEEARQILYDYKNESDDHWKMFGLGQWIEMVNIIYKQYTMLESYDKPFHETIYGLDFGFNAPSALIQINNYDNEFYLREMLYKTHLTNNDLIAQLKEVIPHEHKVRKYPIYADCAEPARIEEICRAGLNVIPAQKDVNDGIDFCKSQKFYTLPSNVNLNKEREDYCYKKDRDGNILDEPVKVRDHLVDSKRYGLYTHYKDILGRDLKKELKQINDEMNRMKNRPFVNDSNENVLDEQF